MSVIFLILRLSLVAVAFLAFFSSGDEDSNLRLSNPSWTLFFATILGTAIASYFIAQWRSLPHRPPEASPGRVTRRVLLLLFSASAGITSYTSWTVFKGEPFLEDMDGYLAQAQLFAAGRITGSLANLASLNPSNMIVIESGHWYGIHPPGHPFLLALGMLAADPPWVVNVLFGAGCVVLLILITQTLYANRATTLLAGTLACLSTGMTFMAANYFNHVPCHFFLLLFLYLTLRMVSCNDYPARLILSASAALGAAFLIRPYTALGFCTIPAAILVLALLKKSNRRTLLCVSFLLPLALSFGLYALFNHLTTGEWLTSGYERRYGAAHNPGFHTSPHGFEHTFARGVSNVLIILQKINLSLFSWPIPSLTFVFALFTLRAPLRKELIVLSAVAGQATAQVLYWENPQSRFLFESSGIFIVFTAAGLVACGAALQKFLNLERLPHASFTAFTCCIAAVAYLFIVGYELNIPTYQRYVAAHIPSDSPLRKPPQPLTPLWRTEDTTPRDTSMYDPSLHPELLAE